MTKEIVEHRISIAHETLLQSLISDAGTFALSVGLFAPAIYFHSTPLELIGGFVWCTFIFSLAVREKLTIEQARAKLDEIEKSRAN